MKTSSYVGLVGALALSGLFLTTPATRARSNNCRQVDGHIDGQVSGFTESGFFFDSGRNTLGHFDAYVTGLEQEGEGGQKLQLAHTYTTNGGDEFTTGLSRSFDNAQRRRRLGNQLPQLFACARQP